MNTQFVCIVGKESNGTQNNYTPEEWDHIIEKRKATNIKRYGVEHAPQSEDIKKKTIETNLKKYGVEFTSQTKEWKNQVVGAKRLNYNRKSY